jgi:hypothetical protein
MPCKTNSFSSHNACVRILWVRAHFWEAWRTRFAPSGCGIALGTEFRTSVRPADARSRCSRASRTRRVRVLMISSRSTSVDHYSGENCGQKRTWMSNDHKSSNLVRSAEDKNPTLCILETDPIILKRSNSIFPFLGSRILTKRQVSDLGRGSSRIFGLFSRPARGKTYRRAEVHDLERYIS